MPARARVSLVSWEGRSHALLFMVPLGLPSARPMGHGLLKRYGVCFIVLYIYCYIKIIIIIIIITIIIIIYTLGIMRMICTPLFIYNNNEKH